MINLERRRKRATESFSTFDAVGVRKGSVIGVYLDNSSPLPVIGTKPSGNPIIDSTPIGACVLSSSSASISTINCTTGNMQSTYVIHAEANISKFDFHYYY